MYGSEIWGVGDIFEVVDKLHYNFCELFLIVALNNYEANVLGDLSRKERAL